MPIAQSDVEAVLDVVTLGEAMVLLMTDAAGPLERAAAFAKRTAGAETNVAIGLVRLGLRVGWASRLGTDSFGRFLLESLQAEGVDCTHVACAEGERTGFMIKGCTTDGSDPATEYHRAGSAASRMSADDLDLPWLASATHLHATGVFPALSPACFSATRASFAAMRSAGRTISFDPNLRPVLWPSMRVMCDTVNALACNADWVLPGLDEGRLLTGEATPEGIAAYYRRRGVALVVVKLGARGAYHDSAAGTGFVAGWPVDRVVDTVGAGDGFAVGLLSALLRGIDLAHALRRAVWVGARVVQFTGDTEGLPTLDDLRAAGL